MSKGNLEKPSKASFEIQVFLDGLKSFLRSMQKTIYDAMDDEESSSKSSGSGSGSGSVVNIGKDFLEMAQGLEEQVTEVAKEKELVKIEMDLFKGQIRKKENEMLDLTLQNSNLQRKLKEFKKYTLGRNSKSYSLMKSRRGIFGVRTTGNIGGRRNNDGGSQQVLKDYEVGGYILKDNDYRKMRKENEIWEQKVKYLETALKSASNRNGSMMKRKERQLIEKEEKLLSLKLRISNCRKQNKPQKLIDELSRKYTIIQMEINKFEEEMQFSRIKSELSLNEMEEKIGRARKKQREVREKLKGFGIDDTVHSVAKGKQYPDKYVCIVFTDIQDSTKLWEMDMDLLAESIQLHNELIRHLISKYDGYEVKSEGDSFMIAFAEIIDGVNFCVRCQQELVNAQWSNKLMQIHEAGEVFSKINPKKPIWRGLKVRMGIHAGYPIVKVSELTHRADYFGPVVNRAARIMSIADGGHVVMSEEIYNFVKKNNDSLEPGCHIKSLGFHALKGISDQELIHAIYSDGLYERFENKKKKDSHGKTKIVAEQREDLSKMQGSGLQYRKAILWYTPVILEKTNYLKLLFAFMNKKVDTVIKDPESLIDTSLQKERRNVFKAIYECQSLVEDLRTCKFEGNGTLMKKNLSEMLLKSKSLTSGFFDKNRIGKKAILKKKKFDVPSKYMNHFEEPGFSRKRSYSENLNQGESEKYNEMAADFFREKVKITGSQSMRIPMRKKKLRKMSVKKSKAKRAISRDKLGKKKRSNSFAMGNKKRGYLPSIRSSRSPKKYSI